MRDITPEYSTQIFAASDRVATLVEQETRCFLGRQAVSERTEANVQHLIDTAPNAVQYCTDGFPVYVGRNHPFFAEEPEEPALVGPPPSNWARKCTILIVRLA